MKRHWRAFETLKRRFFCSLPLQKPLGGQSPKVVIGRFSDYLDRMRILAVMAFVALQLSIFTCGYDIHVHHMDADTGVIAHHHDPMDGDHGQMDHACQIHASHVFAEQKTFALKSADTFLAEIQQPITLNTVTLQYRIERPPKHLYS